MAWIEKHGDGYRVAWWTAGRGSHKGRSPTLGSKTEAAAELRAVEAREATKPGAKLRACLPWAKLTACFLASREGSTTEAHRKQMRVVLDRLGAGRKWRTSADVKPADCLTVKSYHGRVLRALLRYAILADQQVDARCLMVRPLRERKALRARDSVLLTAQQVADLVASADRWHPADGALVHCIATYGTRAESLIHLTCGALNGDGTLSMPVKSGDAVRRELRPETIVRLSALADGRKPDAPLFVGHRGVPWASGRALSSWLVNCVARGPGKGVLDLRRFATTRLMDAAGQDARTVADVQGRRTVSLVHEVYQRSNDQRRKAAIHGLQELPQPSPCPPGAPRRIRKSLTGH